MDANAETALGSAEQFAALNGGVKAQTVRSRVSREGSYFGVVPVKLANGRTLYPLVRVLKGSEPPAEPTAAKTA